MSKMAELDYDIEQLYIEENLSAKQIAKRLNCPVEVVAGWIVCNGVREFSEWEPAAQSRLINDIVGVADLPQEEASPFNTINS